jgi:hypothetical protein
MRAICADHLIFLNLTICFHLAKIASYEAPNLCTFLQPPILCLPNNNVQYYSVCMADEYHEPLTTLCVLWRR